MRINARAKGRAFEQLIAKHIRNRWPSATVRRSLQADQAYEPDIVIEGTAPALVKRLWIECHHGNTPIAKKMEQAERDCERVFHVSGTRLPVVVSRKNRGRIQVSSFVRFDGCEGEILATADFHEWLEALPE